MKLEVALQKAKEAEIRQAQGASLKWIFEAGESLAGGVTFFSV